jgi:hypothetical protein
MNQETVDNVRAVIAARQKAIIESENPKKAAIDHLKEMGFLNPDGTLAERFGGPATKTTFESVADKPE